MRSDLEDNKANQLRLFSGRFGTEKQSLGGDVTFTKDTPVYNAFDPNGSDRIITLPSFERGRFFIVAHEGTTNLLTVKDSGGTTVCVARASELHFLACSGNKWTTNPGTFGVAGAGHSTGLVPDPGAVSGLARFLMDDGTWTSVTTAGIVDAYKQISDGTNTAVASGLTQLRVRSGDSAIVPTVTNNDPTYGDVLDLQVDEAHVDHNSLQNYVADQHVAHSGVLISAGTGLSGGGAIDSSRTLSLDLHGLVAATPELQDEIPIYDISASAVRKMTGTTLNAILDHNALVNYSANRHIDHTAVSITGGTGLSGGGTIDATRTISLDISGLASDTPVLGDKVLFYDISGSDHNLTTFTTINGILDHNALLNYDANRHIDHTAVSISTTEGIQGGGTIAATRTLKLDINTLTADATPDSAADYVVTYDASASLHKKVLLSNLPSVSFDLHGLSALTAPDTADEAVLYDVSASGNRKIILSDLFKVIDTFTDDTSPASGDEVVTYDVSASGTKKATLANLFKAWGTTGAVDNAILRADGTGAATLQSTGVTIDDSNNMSGVVVITTGDGAVGAPAHSFTADPDCGLYRIGTNNIGVAVNGAKVLDVGTAGLGVTGTLTSTSTFTVASTATGGMSCDTSGTLTVGTGAVANGFSIILFKRSNTTLADISYNSGTGGVNYNLTSDYRVKTELEPIRDPLALLEQLNPTYYQRIENKLPQPVMGFLAHEFERIIPWGVTGKKDDIDEKGLPLLQRMDQGTVIPLLVASIQEAKQRIEKLEEEIQKLQT